MSHEEATNCIFLNEAKNKGWDTEKPKDPAPPEPKESDSSEPKDSDPIEPKDSLGGSEHLTTQVLMNILLKGQSNVSSDLY